MNHPVSISQYRMIVIIKIIVIISNVCGDNFNINISIPCALGSRRTILWEAFCCVSAKKKKEYQI